MLEIIYDMHYGHLLVRNNIVVALVATYVLFLDLTAIVIHLS